MAGHVLDSNGHLVREKRESPDTIRPLPKTIVPGKAIKTTVLCAMFDAGGTMSTSTLVYPRAFKIEDASTVNVSKVLRNTWSYWNAGSHKAKKKKREKKDKRKRMRADWRGMRRVFQSSEGRLCVNTSSLSHPATKPEDLVVVENMSACCTLCGLFSASAKPGRNSCARR